ncbi:MAG: NAD(P)-dependent oxidoreductase [Defluviicoccus sp.]|nr:NAD(P)-dependent oxidoreductase [Defluviicoccus sp.]MDE0385501.1 NAD(P)-dependent oxidoreductase [Defluviicoccus sp.]
MELRRVGMIGVGAMGRPMAEHVARAGYALRLHDTEPGRAQEAAQAAGGQVANGPAGVAAGSDVVITMLPTGADVARTALDPGGLADGFSGGGILIDMSSSEPSSTVALAAALAERGVAMIDAPVSGGRKGAVEGTLTIMAGGDGVLVERCRPLLAAMGKRVVHTGPIGSGHALKALNNTISAAGFLAAVEAFLVGRRFGLEPETMAEVVNSSTGMNNATRNKLAQFVFSRRFDSGFSMDLMVKDLDIALDLARDTATAAPLAALSREIWAQAQQNLEPGRDHTEIVRWLELLARAELR